MLVHHCVKLRLCIYTFSVYIHPSIVRTPMSVYIYMLRVTEDINVCLCIYTHTVYIYSLVLYVHPEVCTFICLCIYTPIRCIYTYIVTKC